MEKLMTVEQTAEILNVRKTQVYYWISESILPAIRIGRCLRISPEVLREFIENGGKSYEGGWKKEA